MRSFTLALACAMAPLAAQAQGYFTFNRLDVVPLNQTDFEVIEARGEGPRGIWCAAADYAQNRAGLTQGRIYIKSPRGPSVTTKGRKGVVFSTRSPAKIKGRGVSISVRQVGYSLPVNHAIQFCKDYQIELNDISYGARIFP